jgi:hypothetical protein
VLVEPGDPAALGAGIRRAAALVGRSFADARSWDDTRQAMRSLLGDLGLSHGTPLATTPGG